MQSGQLYHYSITTLKLQPLLKESFIFEKILHNLQLLVNAKQIKLYGYAVLSNRLEFLWEMTNDTDEESPHIQFLKLSSFDFLEELRQKDKKLLDLFCIDMLFQKIQFWQKSYGPVHIKNERDAAMALENIHGLAQEDTQLTEAHSSQAFYSTGANPYNLLQPYQAYFADVAVNVN